MMFKCTVVYSDDTKINYYDNDFAGVIRFISWLNECKEMPAKTIYINYVDFNEELKK